MSRGECLLFGFGPDLEDISLECISEFGLTCLETGHSSKGECLHSLFGFSVLSGRSDVKNEEGSRGKVSAAVSEENVCEVTKVGGKIEGL